jgi:hypothetical protein
MLRRAWRSRPRRVLKSWSMSTGEVVSTSVMVASFCSSGALSGPGWIET